MDAGIDQLDNVAVAGEVSTQEVVEHWVEEVVGEGIDKHGHQEDPGLVPGAQPVVLIRRLFCIELYDRQDDHIHQMPNDVHYEAQALVDVLSVVSLQEPD